MRRRTQNWVLGRGCPWEESNKGRRSGREPGRWEKPEGAQCIHRAARPDHSPGRAGPTGCWRGTKGQPGSVPMLSLFYEMRAKGGRGRTPTRVRTDGSAFSIVLHAAAPNAGQRGRVRE